MVRLYTGLYQSNRIYYINLNQQTLKSTFSSQWWPLAT